MQAFMRNFLNELHDMVELIWWSFIKAPIALIGAWGFFSMLANPAGAAQQTMLIARSGSIPDGLMAAAVNAWFLCACTVFSISIFTRLVLKTRFFQTAEEHSEKDSAFCFHS